MKKYRHLHGTLFDIERELRTRNSGVDEAISEAMVQGNSPPRRQLTREVGDVFEFENNPAESEADAAAGRPAAPSSSSAVAPAPALAAMKGMEATQKKYPQRNLNTWMNLIPDDTPLSLIIMPGSHDALVNKEHYKPKKTHMLGRSTPKNTVCQEVNILGQLERGSRFFDIRLEKNSEGEVLGIHSEGISDMIGDGGYGQSWEEAVKEAVDFLNKFEDQFIIFKVTHVKGITKFHEVLKNTIKDEEQLEKRILDLQDTERQNIAQLTYKDLKGKLIVVTDAKEGLESRQKGIHKFVKGNYEKKVVTRNGLKVYAAFAGTWNIDNIISKAQEAMDDYAKIENPKDGIMQIYWQRTDYRAGVPLIQGNLEEGAKELKKYLHNIKHFHNTRDHSGGIVSYDFVNEISSEMIINLNTRIFEQKA